MKQIVSSGFFNLNLRDFLKGALVAIFSAVLPIIYDTLQAGSFIIDWKTVGTVATSTFVAYLLKQLMGGNEVIVKDINAGQALLLKKGITKVEFVDVKKKPTA